MLDVFIKVGALIVGALGFSWGVFEYINRRRQKRVERALEYVDKLSKDPIKSARNRIDVALTSGLEGLTHAIAAAADKDAAYADGMKTLIKEHNLEDNVFAMIEFFDELAIATDANICDKRTVKIFFHRPMKIFFNQFLPFILEKRREFGDDSLGAPGLKLFRSISAVADEG